MATFNTGERPPEILFPPKDAELWAGVVDGKTPRPFVLAGRGDGAIDWYVDGDACPIDDAGQPVWTPQKSGFYTVSAVDEAGREARVQVRVIGAPTG